MADTNVVVISGRLTKDPELKTSQSGMSYCQFTIANSRKKDESSFFNFTAFGKTAEYLCNYAKKGSYVITTGSVEQRKYTNKDGVEVTGYSFTTNSADIIGGKAPQQNTAPAVPQQNPAPAPHPVAPESNEELPF